MKDRGFAESVAIVTGGASGIGRALAFELHRRGAEVVVADRQLDAAEAVAAAIRVEGGRAVAALLDVRDDRAFCDLVEATAARAGRVDYLFNNAGIVVGAEIADYLLEDWNDVIDVNLRGVTNGVQAVYGQMIRQGSGHIVNTASMAGLVASPLGSYSATKHAVVGLSKALRLDGRRHGIRVSVLCPGAIRTPILTGGKFGRFRFPGVTDAKVLELWDRMRPIEPEELARQALDGVARNDAFIIVPRWWKAVWLLERLAPSLSLRLWGAMNDRMRSELVPPGA